MTKEIYYAIRIGKLLEHQTYFMLQEHSNEPELFSSEAVARYVAKKDPKNRTAVRVELKEIEEI